MYTYVDSILAAPSGRWPRAPALTSPVDGKTRSYVLYVRKTTTNNNNKQQQARENERKMKRQKPGKANVDTPVIWAVLGMVISYVVVPAYPLLLSSPWQ